VARERIEAAERAEMEYRAVLARGDRSPRLILLGGDITAHLAALEAAEARLSRATFFSFKRPKDDYSTYTVHIYQDDLSNHYGEAGKSWEVTVYEKGPDGVCLHIPFCVRVKTQEEAWAAYEDWAAGTLETEEGRGG
jgi:hypothetical protein